MQITILGATGRVGREVMLRALADGHSVHALVRSIEKLELSHPQLTAIVGDAREEAVLKQAVAGSSVVISALGTDGGNTLSSCFPGLLAVMAQQAIHRLVTVGTAGILESRTEPGLLRYQSSESKRRSTRAAEEHHAVLRLLEASAEPLNWTLVCPTYLPDGPYTGVYRSEQDYLPEGGLQITVGDTADFTYKEAIGGAFTRCRVGLAE
ncbi:NAD(P)H-binding protein [Paenibacillus algorifonticola]|uniref:NAD(P)-dependent oxidoreductase n=1 Tax=Paenibacillus algorifonticola TaxID=684063 RepID=UPI003D28355A